jgi:hypothetical protein
VRFGVLLIVCCSSFVRRYKNDAHVRAYLASMLWVAMKTTTRGFLPPGENACSVISAATQRPGPGADNVATLVLIVLGLAQHHGKFASPDVH